MLRLWLSLAVDYEGDIPEPLPNLDYKVAIGDSVTGPAPEPPEGQLRPEDSLIQQIQEHTANYLIAHTNPEKQELRETITELKRDLQGWSANQNEFVWQVEFPEVFQEGGFDIIIGNPPYIRHHKIKHLKPTLKTQFGDFFSGMADLYVYFYKRGTELLRAGGVLTYISSNTFLRAAFARKLRQFFTNKMSLQKLLDFGSVPVFGASVDTCILLVEKFLPREEAFLAATFRDKADIPRLSDAFHEQAISIHARDLSADGWALTSLEALRLLERLENTGTPLGRYVDGGFYIGVITGCNDAFVIGETVRQQLIVEDARNGELIKPVLRGKNLRKWKAAAAKDYLIVMASSADKTWPWSDAADTLEAEQIFAQTYPAIYRHLNSYRERLVVNTNQGKFYWELRSCAYFSISESYANKIYHRMLDILVRVLPMNSKKELLRSDLDSVVIDVTEQPIERPKQQQRQYYSGKKMPYSQSPTDYLLGEFTDSIGHLSKGQSPRFSDTQRKPSGYQPGDREAS